MTSTVTTTNAAEIRGLTKWLDGFSLRDIDLTIPAGYITGFVGPNGAGKTSTIKCLLGMLHPDAGEVTVLGRPAGAPSDQVGVVLDSPSLVGDWTVAQTARALGRFYPSWDAAAFAGYCERFALPATAKVKNLSRGMGMKLQIALALSHDTRLLIMDEPTSGLDPVARDDLLELLQDYMLDERNAVLFSTHITTDLERVADFIVVIDGGRILHAEPRDDLLARYALVQGGDLPADARPLALGLREAPTGYTCLAETDQLLAFGPQAVVSPASLDQIVLHLSRKSPR